MSARVKAKWSGSEYALCFGKWVLVIDGENVSDYIPEELRNSHMNTLGIYNRWHFQNWMDIWEDYQDGLEMDEWIEENKDWLHKITKDKELLEEIFVAIQKEDFRPQSCGGCI